MTMKLVARCLFLAGAVLAVLMLPSTMNAQWPPRGSTSAESRRAEEAILDNWDLQRISSPNEPPEFWNTPEGKARYEQLQLESFEENVEELSDLGKEDWATRYDSVSDRQPRRDFENRTEDLETVTEDMIKFLEWRFDAEPIEVDEPSEESVRDWVLRITPIVEQILETISTLTGGGIQIEEFVAMRENLAQIHALTQVLRD